MAFCSSAVLLSSAGMLAERAAASPTNALLWADRIAPEDEVAWKPEDHRPVPAGMWVPSAVDQQRGYAAGVVSTQLSLTPRWVWDEPALVQTLQVAAAPGQSVSRAIAVRSLEKPVSGLQWSGGVLKSEAGDVLTADQLDIRVARYPDPRLPMHVHGHYLERRFPLDLPAHWTSWQWLIVHVPAHAAAGVYEGQLILTSESAPGQPLAFAVRLEVLDFEIPLPEGSWGTFVPGHFLRKNVGTYRNFATEEWIAERMTRHFQLWKHYGLNSPSFYHVYPELAVIDGKVHATFNELDQFIAAMKQAGIAGDVCLDLRFLLRWAEVAGQRLERRKIEGASLAGDLGVPGHGGLWELYSSHERYGEAGKELATQVVQQLLAHAQANDWPRVLLMIEEELAHANKREFYEAFKDAIIKVAPENHLLVDNVVGYGSPDAVDRGERDRVPVRQYNNWTAHAMQDARASGAEIRIFNYGWMQGFGFYCAAYGSTGFHQWADHWGARTDSHVWKHSAVLEAGVIGSVQLTRLREGLYDLGAYRLLEKLGNQLAQSGQAQAAAEVAALLGEVVADIPVNRFAYSDWHRQMSPDDLEMRRWYVIQAIRSAREKLGRGQAGSQAATASAGMAAIRHLRPLRAAEDPSEAPHVVRAPLAQAQDKYADGWLPGRFWGQPGARTADFTWTQGRLIGLRSAAGSPDETLPTPSWARAGVVYSDAGLYLQVTGNHVVPERAQATHGDDDANLWEDDCFEFFLAVAPEAPYFQFIISAAGKRTLIQSGKVLPAAGVRIQTRSPLNATGGYEQEIFVPWQVLGLAGAPAVGSVWEMNIGRELHSWNQISTWAPVRSQFSEREHWGRLVFGSTPGEIGFDQLRMGQGFPGRNMARGVLLSTPAWQGQRVDLTLVDGQGQRRHQRAVTLGSDGRTPFDLPYDVPDLTESQRWILEVRGPQKQLLNSMPLPLEVVETPLAVATKMRLVQAGRPVVVDLVARVGELSAEGRQVGGHWISEDGRTRVPIAPAALPASGSLRAWIGTEGLIPGRWTLSLGIAGQTSGEASSVAIRILPAI